MNNLRNLDDRASPYQILSKISEGSYGRVYRARKRGTGTQVSLKVLTKNLSDGRTSADVHQEVSILKKLNHKNIVQFIDFFETQGEFVIVTLLAQTDLSVVLKEQNILTESEIQWLLKSILPALHYLHDQKIIHGDLKPSNILLLSDGTPQLCDFGFARILEQGTSLKGTLRGSMEYLSPEIVGQKEYDWRADLWSLGVVLFELRTGSTPFASPDMFTFLRRVQEEEVQYPVEISDTFVDFLKGLLQKDPGARFDWKTILSHPFLTKTLNTPNIFMVDILEPRNNGYISTLDDYEPKIIKDLEDKYPEIVSEQGDSLKTKRDELYIYLHTVEDTPDLPRPSNIVPLVQNSPRISSTKDLPTLLREVLEVDFTGGDDWGDYEDRHVEQNGSDALVTIPTLISEHGKNKITKGKKKKLLGEKKSKVKVLSKKSTSSSTKPKDVEKLSRKKSKSPVVTIKPMKPHHISTSSKPKHVKKKVTAKRKLTSNKTSIFTSTSSQGSQITLIQAVPVQLDSDSITIRTGISPQHPGNLHTTPAAPTSPLRKTNDRISRSLSDLTNKSLTEADFAPLSFYAEKETEPKPAPRRIRDILFVTPSRSIITPFNTSHRFSLRPQPQPVASTIVLRQTHSLDELPPPKPSQSSTEASMVEVDEESFMGEYERVSSSVFGRQYSVPLFEGHDIRKLEKSIQMSFPSSETSSRVSSSDQAKGSSSGVNIQIHTQSQYQSRQQSVSIASESKDDIHKSNKSEHDDHGERNDDLKEEKMEKKSSVNVMNNEPQQPDPSEGVEQSKRISEDDGKVSEAGGSSIFSSRTPPSRCLSHPIDSPVIWKRHAITEEIRDKLRFVATPTLLKAYNRTRRRETKKRRQQQKRSRSLSPPVSHHLRTLSAQARLGACRHVETDPFEAEWLEEETVEDELSEDATQSGNDASSQTHSTIQNSSNLFRSVSQLPSDHEPERGLQDDSHYSDSPLISDDFQWKIADHRQPTIATTARANFGNDLLDMFVITSDKEDDFGREDEESDEDDMSLTNELALKSSIGEMSSPNGMETDRSRNGHLIKRGESGSMHSSVRHRHLSPAHSPRMSSDPNSTGRRSVFSEHPFLSMTQSATIVLPSADLTQMSQSLFKTDVTMSTHEEEGFRKGNRSSNPSKTASPNRLDEHPAIPSSSLSLTFPRSPSPSPTGSGTSSSTPNPVKSECQKSSSATFQQFKLVKESTRRSNLIRTTRLLRRNVQPATRIPKDLLILSFRHLFSLHSDSNSESFPSFSNHKSEMASYVSPNLDTDAAPRQMHGSTFTALQNRADAVLPSHLRTRTSLSHTASSKITRLISAFTQVINTPTVNDSDVFLSSMILHTLLVRSGVASLTPSYFNKTNGSVHFPSPPNLLPLILSYPSTPRRSLPSQTRLHLFPKQVKRTQKTSLPYSLSALTAQSPVIINSDFPHPSQTSDDFPSFGTFEHSLSYAGMPHEIVGSESCSFHSPLPPFASLFRPPLPHFDFSLHNTDNRREIESQKPALATPFSSTGAPPHNTYRHSFVSVTRSSPSAEAQLPIPEWLGSRWGVFKWIPLDLFVPVALPYLSTTTMRISRLRVPYIPPSLTLHSYTVDEAFDLECMKTGDVNTFSENRPLHSLFEKPPDCQAVLSVDWLGVVSTFLTAVKGMAHSIRAMTALFRTMFSSLVGSFWNGSWRPLWAYKTERETKKRRDVYLFEEDDWLMNFVDAITPFFHNIFVAPSLLAHTLHPQQPQEDDDLLDTMSLDSPDSQSQTRQQPWTFLRWQHLLSLAFPSLVFSPQCAILPRDVATHVLFASRIAHRKLHQDSLRHPSSFVSPIPLDASNPQKRIVGVCPSEEVVRIYYHKQVQQLQRASCDCLVAICDLLESVGTTCRLSSKAHDFYVKKILMAMSASPSGLECLPNTFSTREGFLARIVEDDDYQMKDHHPNMIPNVISDSHLNTLQRMTRELAQCLGATLFGGRWRWNSIEMSAQLVCVIHGVGACNCVREWKSELSRCVYESDSNNITQYQGGKNVSPTSLVREQQHSMDTPAPNTSDRKEDEVKPNLLTTTYLEMKGRQRLIKSTSSVPVLQSPSQLVLFYTLVSSLSSLLSCLLFPAFPSMAENPDLIFAGEVRGTWEMEFRKLDNQPSKCITLPRSYLNSISAASSPLPFVQALMQTVDTTIQNKHVSVQKDISQRVYDVSSLINSELFNFTVSPERVKEIDLSSLDLSGDKTEIPQILSIEPHETDYPPFPPLISFLLEAYALFTLRTEDASRITPTFTTTHETSSHLLRLLLWVIKIENENMNYSTQPGSIFVNTHISFAEICASLFMYPVRFIARRQLLQLGCLSNYIFKFFLSEASLLDTLIYRTAKSDSATIQTQYTIPLPPSGECCQSIDSKSDTLPDKQEREVTLFSEKSIEHVYPFFVVMASTLDRELENVSVCSLLDKDGSIMTQASGRQSILIDVSKDSPQQTDPLVFVSDRPTFIGMHSAEHHISLVQGLYGFFSTVSVCGHFSPYLFEAAMDDYHSSSSDFFTVPDLGQQIGSVGTSRGRRRSLAKHIIDQEEDTPIITVTSHGQTEDGRTHTPPVFIRLRLMMSRLSINAHLSVPFIPWTGYDANTLTTPFIPNGPMSCSPLFSTVDLPLPVYRMKSGRFTLSPETSEHQQMNQSPLSRFPLTMISETSSLRETPRPNQPLSPPLRKELRLSIFNLPAHVLRFSSIASMMIPHTFPISSLYSSYRYKQSFTTNQNPLILIFEIIKQQPIWIPKQTLAVFTEDFRRPDQLSLLTTIASLEKATDILNESIAYSQLLPADLSIPDLTRLEKETTNETGNDPDSHLSHTEYELGVPFPASLHDSAHRIHSRLVESTSIQKAGFSINSKQKYVILPWANITASLSGVLYQHHFGIISSLIQSFFAFSEAMCFSNTQVSGDVKETFNRVETIKSSVISQTAVLATHPSQSTRLKTRTPRLVMVGDSRMTIMKKQITRRAIAGDFKSVKSILGGWWLVSVPQLIANHGRRKVPHMALQKLKRASLRYTQPQTPVRSAQSTRTIRHSEEKKEKELNWTGALSTLPIPAIWSATTNMFPLRSREQPEHTETHFVSSLLTGHPQDAPYRDRETEYDPLGLPVSQADLLSVSRILAQSSSLCHQVNSDLAEMRPTAAGDTPAYLNTLPLLVQMPMIQTSPFCLETQSINRVTSNQDLPVNPLTHNPQTERGPTFPLVCSHFLQLPDTNIGTDMVMIATKTTKAVEDGEFKEDPSPMASSDSIRLLEEFPLKEGVQKMSLSIIHTPDCAQIPSDLASTSPFPTHLSDSANPVWLIDLLIWAGYAMAAPAPTSFGLSGGVIPQFQQNSVSDGVAQSGIEYVLSFLVRISREVLCHLQQSEKQKAPIPTTLPAPFIHPPRRLLTTQKAVDHTLVLPQVSLGSGIDSNVMLMSAHEDMDTIFYSLLMRQSIVRPINNTSIITSLRISTDFFGAHFPNNLFYGTDSHGKSTASLIQKTDTDITEAPRLFVAQKMWLASEMGNAATQFLRPSQYFFACSVFLVLLNSLSIWESMVEQLDSGQMRVPPSPSNFSISPPPCSASTSHTGVQASSVRGILASRLSPLDSPTSIEVSPSIGNHHAARKSSDPLIITKQSQRLPVKGVLSDSERESKIVHHSYLVNCGTARFEILTTHTLFLYLQMMLHVFHSASRVSRPSLISDEEVVPNSSSTASMSSMSSEGAFPLTRNESTYIPFACIQNSKMYSIKEGFWPNAVSLFLHHSGRVLSLLPTFSSPTFVINTLQWQKKTTPLSRSIGQVSQMRARNVSSLSYLFFMMWEVTNSPLILSELSLLMEAMLSVDNINAEQMFTDMTDLQRLQAEQAWLATYKRSNHNRLFGDTSFSVTLLQSLNNGFRDRQVIKNISETVRMMLRLSRAPFTFMFDFILVTPFEVPIALGERIVDPNTKYQHQPPSPVAERIERKDPTRLRSKSISPVLRSVSPTANNTEDKIHMPNSTFGARPSRSHSPGDASPDAFQNDSPPPNSPLFYTHITGDVSVPGSLTLTQFELLDSILCVLNALLAQHSLRQFLVYLDWEDYLIEMILFVSSLLLNATDENDFIVPPFDLVGGKYATLLSVSELAKLDDDQDGRESHDRWESTLILSNAELPGLTLPSSLSPSNNQQSESTFEPAIPLPSYSFSVKTELISSSLSSTYTAPTPPFATPASPLLIRPPPYLPILRLSMCLHRMLNIIHLLCTERPESRKRIAATSSFASLLIVLSSIRSDFPSVSIYATTLPFKTTTLRSSALALMCLLSGEDENLKLYLDCLWHDARLTVDGKTVAQ